MRNQWVVLSQDGGEHVLTDTRERARGIAKGSGGIVAKVTIAFVLALASVIKRQFDGEVDFNNLLDDGFSGGITSEDTPFNEETGELEGWGEETDLDYDPSFGEAMEELGTMFLGSPSDSAEVDIDINTYMVSRSYSQDSYLAAVAAWKVQHSEFNNGYLPDVVTVGQENLTDDDSDLYGSDDSEESWFDVPVKGASGNGFYRYSRHLADNREDRFLAFLRWVDTADPKVLASSFGPSGTFYRMIQADRAHNLYSDHCKYGPVYRAGSHESVRYTTEQVAALTIAARDRLGWNVNDNYSHVIAYWRNMASEKQPCPTPRPTPAESRKEPVTAVTQERSNLDDTAILTVDETANVSRWDASTTRPVKTSHLTPEALTAPGKVRENRKNKGNGGKYRSPQLPNNPHRSNWGYVKEGQRDSWQTVLKSVRFCQYL